MLVRFCVLSSIAISGSANAANAVRFPTSVWNVEVAPSQCVASRNYGSADRPMYLVLKPSPLGGVMRLAIVQKGHAPLAQTAGKVQFDNKPPLATGILTYTDDSHGNWVASTNVPIGDFDAAGAASSVRVWGSSISETFAVSVLPTVAAELRKCLQTLQSAWNITADRSTRISREAKVKNKKVFDWTDYPRDAIRQSQSGSVKVVFLVDESGVVRDCSVDRTSGIPILDAMSCRVMQTRAKFDPAVGPDGKGVKSIYCSGITWVIYGDKMPPRSPADPRCPAG